MGKWHVDVDWTASNEHKTYYLFVLLMEFSQVNLSYNKETLQECDSRLSCGQSLFPLLSISLKWYYEVR